MPPPLLLDLNRYDLNQVQLTRDQIYEQHLPHRHHFMVLDAVLLCDVDKGHIVTRCDVTNDCWWVPGHIPNRPLLPGVLMLEMAGQACAIMAGLLSDGSAFVGFGGVDGCKFRDTVTPPSTLYVISALKEHRKRRIRSDVQGIVNGKVVFEASITGVFM